jgi:hypothetical protein
MVPKLPSSNVDSARKRARACTGRHVHTVGELAAPRHRRNHRSELFRVQILSERPASLVVIVVVLFVLLCFMFYIFGF